MIHNLIGPVSRIFKTEKGGWASNTSVFPTSVLMEVAATRVTNAIRYLPWCCRKMVLKNESVGPV